MTTLDELVWLYAIRLGGLDAPAGPGVDGEPPRLLIEGDLVAVVGTVAARRFDEAALAASMEDLGRLEGLARAHHAVVVEAGRERPTAPVRLATLYRDDAAVRRLLADRAADLLRVLRRVAGHREWGVKVYVGPEVAQDAPALPAPDAGRPGTSYLLRRRETRDRDGRRREHARESAESLHAALVERSAAAHRFALQDARLSGRAEEMVLNAGYLVADEREEAFRAAVAESAPERIRVELTGPWPAFSFTDWEQP